MSITRTAPAEPSADTVEHPPAADAPPDDEPPAPADSAGPGIPDEPEEQAVPDAVDPGGSDGAAMVPEAGVGRRGAGLPTFEELRWDAEASFTPAAWIAERDHHREVGRLLARLDDLVDRLGRLPLLNERGHLVERLVELSRTDVRECLRLIGQTLSDLAPDAARVVRPKDTESWIDQLRQAIDDLAVRGAPSVVVLPAPDGRMNGHTPRTAVSGVEVRDSKAVMFGADATLTVVHQCEVTQPVIEIATLIDHEQGGPSWSWWGFTPSLRPVETRAAPGVRTRITSCSGVSIGTGNVQHTIIRHRMTSCPVDLAVLLGNDDIRTALVRCRDDSLDPAERDDAKEHLRRIVTRVVGLTDTSALMPGGVIAARAAAAGDLPTVRGGGASLTVLHGVGVAVGWSPRVTGRTTTRVGRFHIR